MAARRYSTLSPVATCLPASASFGEKLYVAWTDTSGSLRLLSGDGEDVWLLHQQVIAEQVTSAPALAVIGRRLCVVATDGEGLFAIRSDDGVVFKDRTPIRIDGFPRDVAVTVYQDWIYLACLAEDGPLRCPEFDP